MNFEFLKKLLIRAGIILLSIITMIEAAQSNDLLRIHMNHARILKFETPVSNVIIGNSDIADVTISDARTIVLTGKSYGSTNLVILNAKGEAIIDRRIVVSVDENNTIRVFRQINRSILSCAPICERQTQTVQPLQ